MLISLSIEVCVQAPFLDYVTIYIGRNNPNSLIAPLKQDLLESLTTRTWRAYAGLEISPLLSIWLRISLIETEARCKIASLALLPGAL